MIPNCFFFGYVYEKYLSRRVHRAARLARVRHEREVFGLNKWYWSDMRIYFITDTCVNVCSKDRYFVRRTANYFAQKFIALTLCFVMHGCPFLIMCRGALCSSEQPRFCNLNQLLSSTVSFLFMMKFAKAPLHEDCRV